MNKAINSAQVVLPEPIPQWLRDLEWCVIEYDRSGDSQAWCPQCGGCRTNYYDGKAGHKDGCELHALLAGVSAQAAQSVANADGRFTKNPVTIDAIKWTGSNLREVIAFTDGLPDTRSIHAGMAWEAYVDLVARDGLKIYTLEGKMLANIGDWIIRGIKGEYYPCKPDIFEATYTSAPQAQADARDADGMYYLQDARWSAMVGNCPSWWRSDGNGYTTNLDEAERFTFEDAMKQHRCRETDLPWLCSEVDKLRRPTVDCQYMPRSWDAQRESIAAIAASTQT